LGLVIYRTAVQRWAVDRSTRLCGPPLGAVYW